MSFKFYYSPEPIYTGDYSAEDKTMINEVMWFSEFLFRNQLEPLLGSKVGNIFKDLRVEFVSKINKELSNAGAIGLAYVDRNLNFFPSGLASAWKNNRYVDKLTFIAHTGVMNMEKTHSVFWRLGRLPEFKSTEYSAGELANDAIHWLYNEEQLDTRIYNAVYNKLGALKVVVPNIGFGWDNRNEIMAGISSGIYAEGKDKYWSDPNGAFAKKYIAAEKHELAHIKEFIKNGTLHRH